MKPSSSSLPGLDIPVRSCLPASPLCSLSSKHAGFSAVLQTHVLFHTPEPLHLLFPLPARLSPQIFTWFLLMIQVSAQIPPPSGGLPDSPLQTLPYPLPVSSSFWFLSLTERDLLVYLFIVCLLPPPQAERKPRNLRPCPSWSQLCFQD